MIDEARVQAVLDIVELISISLAEAGSSADVIIRKYFRTRRYAGSKDRRAITTMVYQVIRNWGFLAETAAGDCRRMLLLAFPEDTAVRAALAPLSAAEETFLATPHPRDSAPHRLNYPLWLESRLQDRFGDDFILALESLEGRAPLELRVMPGHAEMVAAALAAQAIPCQPGKWVDTALILSENPRLDDWPIYKKGQIEVQSEAAQLAVRLADIRPGLQVMDLCAGAGGKTLAAASYMNNRGQIYAYDNNRYRLKDLKPRAKRANVRILQSRHLDTAGGRRQAVLAEHQGKMDRVILDVPCSGSGVWRRNPELKWRLDAEKLAQYCRIQKNLLAEGWGFVKPGGRLIYMTCSLLSDENEAPISAFLATHQDAGLVPYQTVIPHAALPTLSSDPACLALAPHCQGTDGFFVAILEKR